MLHFERGHKCLMKTILNHGHTVVKGLYVYVYVYCMLCMVVTGLRH